MGGVLHIVCGAFAAGTLRAGLQGRRGETVAAFQCGLRYGALFRDFGDAELRRYAAEVERLTGCVGAFDPLHAFVGIDFGGYDKVVVWHGGDVDETLMYYMVCALAAAAPLYEVRVEDVLLRFKRRVRYPSLALCSVDDAMWLRGRMRVVSAERREAAVEQWRAWRQSDAALRIPSENGIAEVAEDYFDGEIIAACGTEYRKAVRVVGEVLCTTDFAVGDSFLHRRIVALLRENRLSARANAVPQRMRRAIEESGIAPIVVGGVDVSAMPLFSVAAV